ncbi:protein TSSC4 [Bufo gargarizans]|uniref:protein TSSC4 n=1 Tax=Bufo gargarizans TaxID=30331 RepID=UPI001CF4A1DE|nr:protein TSSC4 [Bufo gargarizans]XP_044125768.1 protein TSSC4 [Bufo gargarizans]
MSDGRDSTAKPFSAFEYESPNDPDTISLSDSDPESADEAEVTSLSPGEEEEEEEEDDEDDTRRGEKQKEQKSSVLPFTLKGGNARFSQRSHDIFGGLLGVQKSSPLDRQNRKREVVLSDDENEEISDSVIGDVEAAPVKPTSKGSTSAKTVGPTGRVPDYLAHPERWTKYSLENVPDTSDRTNRNTALNFLTELKHQKEAQEVPKEASLCSFNQDSSSSGEGRILFSRPTKKGQQSSDKRGLQSGSLGMSEALTEEGKDESEKVPGERAGAETLGFHGVKKRARKNIRPKKVIEEEGDSS